MSRVKVVRVSCDGEAEKSKTVKHFCAYDVPATDKVFTNGEVSKLTQFMDVPLVVSKLRPSMQKTKKPGRREPWQSQKIECRSAYNEGDDYFANYVAEYLMCGNNDGGQPWFGNVGSILVARQDKEPLEPAHLELIVDFIVNVTAASTDSPEYGIAMLTGEAFKQYYQQATGSAVKVDKKGDMEMKDVDEGGIVI